MMTNTLHTMSVEELGLVAGGSNHETAMDSRFLNDMGTGCDRYGAWKVSQNVDHCWDEISDHWAKFGIKFYRNTPLLGDAGFGRPNEYSLDGKYISRKQAMEHVAQAMGRTFNYSDYD